MAAISCTVLSVEFLLVLADTRGSSVQDIQTEDRKEAAMLASMRGVREALECMGSVMAEGLRLIHRQNNTLSLVDTLTRDNSDLKIQLGTKNQMVGALNQEIEDLKKKLDDNDKTVEAQKKARCVDQDHPQDIKEVVQAYSRNMDWGDLRRGLEAMLNGSSVEYGQLRAGSLYWVGHNGHAELVNLLLHSGLPVDAVDSSGDTMLHGAADNCRLPMVQLLVDNGANVNAVNNYGTTVLMFAAECGNLEVVRKLVQSGAITTTKEEKGYTALDAGWRHPQVVEYLQQLPH